MECSYILMEMQNGTVTVENSLAVSQKVKKYSSYDLAILLLGIYSKEIKTSVHTKTLHTNVYSSSIHNDQKLEIT